MDNLRQRKKSDRNQRIQNAALNLFGSKGFAKTTLAQIAEKADLGVGTVYNYYTSKEEILFSIIQNHSGEYVARLEKIINDTDKNISQAVTAFIGVYLESFSIYNKTIWRELIATGLSSNQAVMPFVDKVDLVYLNKFIGLLNQFKQRKIIRSNVNLREIVSIIHNVLIANILRYLSNEKMTLADVKNSVVQQIKIVLKTEELK
jgi:AcrR family transcriptional regulator